MKKIMLLLLCIVIGYVGFTQRVLKAHYVITGYRYNSDPTFSFQYKNGSSTIDIYNDVSGSQWIVFNDVPGYRVLKGYSNAIAPMQVTEATSSSPTSYFLRKQWNYVIDKNNVTSTVNITNIEILMIVNSDTPFINFILHEGANLSEYTGYAVRLY